MKRVLAKLTTNRFTGALAGAFVTSVIQSSSLLETDDVAVSIEATHYCVKSRGVMDANSRTQTTALGGLFKKRHKTRAEFLASEAERYRKLSSARW